MTWSERSVTGQGLTYDLPAEVHALRGDLSRTSGGRAPRPWQLWRGPTGRAPGTWTLQRVASNGRWPRLIALRLPMPIRGHRMPVRPTRLPRNPPGRDWPG